MKNHPSNIERELDDPTDRRGFLGKLGKAALIGAAGTIATQPLTVTG